MACINTLHLRQSHTERETASQVTTEHTLITSSMQNSRFTKNFSNKDGQTATVSYTENSTAALTKTTMFYLLSSRKLFASKASGTWYTQPDVWVTLDTYIIQGRITLAESSCSLTDARLQALEHSGGSIKVWASIFREFDLMLPLYHCVD